MTPIQNMILATYRGGEFAAALDGDTRILRDPFIAAVFLELGDAGKDDALERLGDMIRDLEAVRDKVAGL
jgi:hypothetical protein